MIEQGDTSFASTGDTDLFGPDPESDSLAYYAPQAPSADLYTQSQPDIR